MAAAGCVAIAGYLWLRLPAPLVHPTADQISDAFNNSRSEEVVKSYLRLSKGLDADNAPGIDEQSRTELLWGIGISLAAGLAVSAAAVSVLRAEVRNADRRRQSPRWRTRLKNCLRKELTMKAAFIRGTGPAESIVVGELPKPAVPAAGTLVKVEAVNVNPIDTYIRSGMVAMTLPNPFILGCDLAGVVEEVGPQAKRFRPGDRVWASNQGMLGRQGAFAEYAAVNEQWLYPTPAGTTSEDAVALSLVGITAHLGLVRNAHLKAGETLFINGGSGGVGSTAVQMAKALGARVITTAGSPENLALCLKLGADVAINYKTEDVNARINEAAPHGVNVWWETLREPNFDRAVSHLAPRGRMVIMAGRDARPQFPVGPFYVKGCSLYGFAMFNATASEQQAAADDINRWLSSGKLRANIARVMPLSEAAAAHKLQEENTIGKAGTLTGKIVLKP